MCMSRARFERCKVLRLEVILLALCCARPLAAADVNIVKKADWNGREATGELTPLKTPVERVVIMHTAGSECSDLRTCSAQARALQLFHTESLPYYDVAYNFMIGNDGSAYEGRGWDAEGAFARGYNAGSLGIAFFGTFHRSLPSDAALEAAKNLIDLGVSSGKIQSNYKLFGARQLTATESPGSALYQAIKQWPQWSQNL